MDSIRRRGKVVCKTYLFVKVCRNAVGVNVLYGAAATVGMFIVQ